MIATFYSLIPPLLALTLVLITKRVVLSLGSGIVAAALLIAIDREAGLVQIITKTGEILYSTVKHIFWENGHLNTGNLYIILFLLFLGIITAFITISGGSKAFAEWAITRVKTRRGAQYLTALLGIIIFIDDYFNALAVGQIARPVTDRQRVSRAKLAYIIDSTSAPICVVSPISSWGAYIVALIGTIFVANNIQSYSPLSAFILMIPLNFYVWSALFLVFFSISGNINFGPMREHEERAEKEAILFDPAKQAPGVLEGELPIQSRGKMSNLLVPILALFVSTVGSMIGTGYVNSGGEANLLLIFENTNVSLSLLIGGSFGLLVAFLWPIKTSQRTFPRRVYSLAIKEGIKAMLPAISILLFAWSFSSLISILETGIYLAGLIEQAEVNTTWLPLLLFTIAGFMAFATGSSWGSFGILLPIAGTIAATVDETILLSAMAAVLAGSVFGDHCSPISDTTILSATGAGCHHIDHAITQIPYALVSAVAAAAGYFILGLTQSHWLGLIITISLSFVIPRFLGKRHVVLTGNETGQFL